MHCYLGVSRSASFVIAYVMELKGISFDHALDYVNDKKKCNPNIGFEAQ